MAAFDSSRSSIIKTVTLFAAIISSINTAGTSSISSSTTEPLAITGGEKMRYLGLEGGPILISTSQQGSYNITTESNNPNEVKARENTRERYASRIGSVVARKGVEEKIKPRKGVQEDTPSTKNQDQNIEENVEKENVSLNHINIENVKPMIEGGPVRETVHIESDTFNINNTKLNTTNLSRTNNNLNYSTNSNESLILGNGTSHQEIASNINVSKASLHIEKHIPKPKPTVTTVEGPEINESIPLSRKKTPPLGMPRKIDYIVPVIITIIALPILGTVIFISYRRGRDCWDKRHYRRMDFLIDGMYND